MQWLKRTIWNIISSELTKQSCLTCNYTAKQNHRNIDLSWPVPCLLLKYHIKTLLQQIKGLENLTLENLIHCYVSSDTGELNKKYYNCIEEEGQEKRTFYFSVTYFHLFQCVIFLSEFTSKIMRSWNYEYPCFVVNALQGS